MSSGLYVFDNFITDSFSPFCDTSIDFLQANNQIPVDESCSIDQFSHNILSCSPHLQQQPLAANGYRDFSCLDSMDVRSEDPLAGFDISSSSSSSSYNQIQEPLVPHSSYSGVENVVTKLTQRSCSSNSFDGKPGFLFQFHFDSPCNSPNFYDQSLSSPGNSFFAGQIRRVCSTGDLQNTITPRKTQRCYSSPLATESSFMEEANFKVGRYSAEEKKERILKYRAKRNQRNFNKTIKYACRKTLADSRNRIRGRFARNDEARETSKAAYSARYDDEDELWLDGSPQDEEDDGAKRGGGPFASRFGQHQLQFYGCY